MNDTTTHWNTPPRIDRTDTYMESIRVSAELLVRRAATYGVVLTIEQRPLQPLAMGNYETVVLVRPAREVGK